MTELQPSRTAVVVCQARAVANGRLAPGRFADPVARHLLRPDEQAEVDLARGPAPRQWSERWTYEFLAATAEILATRTVAIDEAVRARNHRQLVILGAGLDARAWRMPELADATVFEVDQPASQEDKRARVGQLGARAESVVFVPVEFGRDSLRGALSEAGFNPSSPTTWIWEGVLPYLTASQVHATLDDIRACSAIGSQLVATYSARRVINGPARLLVGVLFRVAGRTNPMANEPHVSEWTPAQMQAMLAAHGWTVATDVDQLALGTELNLVRHPEQQIRSRIVTAGIA